MPKESEYVKCKNFERIIKSPFKIYADFESILVAKDYGKQSKGVLYTNKCQKDVACSYGNKLLCVQKDVACSYSYKLLCVNDKFNKSFKSYLGKDAVYNFIESMIEKSKYCSEGMKKHFNKELVVTNKR